MDIRNPKTHPVTTSALKQKLNQKERPPNKSTSDQQPHAPPGPSLKQKKSSHQSIKSQTKETQKQHQSSKHTRRLKPKQLQAIEEALKSLESSTRHTFHKPHKVLDFPPKHRHPNRSSSVSFQPDGHASLSLHRHHNRDSGQPNDFGSCLTGNRPGYVTLAVSSPLTGSSTSYVSSDSTNLAGFEKLEESHGLYTVIVKDKEKELELLSLCVTLSPTMTWAKYFKVFNHLGEHIYSAGEVKGPCFNKCTKWHLFLYVFKVDGNPLFTIAQRNGAYCQCNCPFQFHCCSASSCCGSQSKGRRRKGREEERDLELGPQDANEKLEEWLAYKEADSYLNERVRQFAKNGYAYEVGLEMDSIGTDEEDDFEGRRYQGQCHIHLALRSGLFLGHIWIGLDNYIIHDIEFNPLLCVEKDRDVDASRSRQCPSNNQYQVPNRNKTSSKQNISNQHQVNNTTQTPDKSTSRGSTAVPIEQHVSAGNNKPSKDQLSINEAIKMTTEEAEQVSAEQKVLEKRLENKNPQAMDDSGLTSNVQNLKMIKEPAIRGLNYALYVEAAKVGFLQDNVDLREFGIQVNPRDCLSVQFPLTFEQEDKALILALLLYQV